jgi:hypothetical protein
MIICQNSGRATGGLSSCDCKAGFTGRFCEIPQCTRGGNKPDLDTEHRTFVLLLDGVQTAAYKPFLDNLSTGLADFFKAVTVPQPNWWTSFVGVIFRDAGATGGAVTDVVTQSTSDQFTKSLTDLLAQIPYATANNGRSVFTAMVAA